MLICGFWSSEALGQSSNVTLRGQLTFGPDLADIWGWTDPDNGKEYALVGSYQGLHIVDVSNPDAPVELHFVNHFNSLWRDVKTWGNYAYVVGDQWLFGGGGSTGMIVIDMSNLPGSISTSFWDGGINFRHSHNIFIDENGYGYLCGSTGGLNTVIIDIDANPSNPVVVGSYDDRYVHDLYVRNDIMYAAEINDGTLAMVDVSDKANPVVLGRTSTPSNFTHNVWVNDAETRAYTTDEVSGAVIGVYDITDPTDITEVNRWRPNGGSSAPHNTYVSGDFLFTAWYRDGLRICDISKENQVIEVGFYDTSPLSNSGFNGAWGCYPYFPSGNVVVSDIEEGLFVLTPSYTQAAFIEGNVTDAGTGAPLFDVNVSISGLDPVSTNIFGQYETGLAGSATVSVTFSKPGYAPQTISGVSLTEGSTTILDASLSSGSACSTPVNLNASGISGSSATLSWDAVPGAVAYLIEGRLQGSSGSRSRVLSSNSITINILSPFEDYEFRVQADCGSGTFSAFSAWEGFSTGSPRSADLDGEIKLFPNPGNGQINIYLGTEQSFTSWRLLSVDGRQLDAGAFSSASNSHQLDLSDHPNGLYFIQLIGESAEISQQLLQITH
jgi:choice-of-anchor B domain-containing protein